ncbi:MAG TPA: YciI family protein [Polyangiaceae bacterium]|nr:YciI family protein [Polyangiaceae bacterium]
MKFMLMMHAPRGTGDYAIYKWKPEDMKAHIEFMIRLNKDLRGDGVLVGAEGLSPPGEARIVRAGKGTAPEVTDGPFAESKEFLVGYWIVDVESPEQAYAIAGRASAAPGPGGTPLNMAIEVRRVMDGPPPTDS